MYSYNVLQGQYEYLDGTIRENVPHNQLFYCMYSYNVLQGQYEYLDGTIREDVPRNFCLSIVCILTMCCRANTST